MNVIICKELEENHSVSPFAIEITDPSKTTVSDLKTKVSGTTSITKEELILYFNDNILPDNTPLSDWKGLRGGAIVIAAIKPLKVTLQRYSSPVEVIFTVQKQAIKKWSTRTFFDFCLYKGGLPYLSNNGVYMFAVGGMVIKEEGKMMSEYECFKNDLTISVASIHAVTKIGYDNLGEFYTAFPSTSFMETTLGYEKKNQYRSNQIWGEGYSNASRNTFSHPWIINVKLINGKENVAKVNSRYFTPIHELKQQISPDSSIRLTFGSTILEDWDEEGNMMLLCSYPDLHDGATLYQINLTGGIRVKYNFIDDSNEEVASRKVCRYKVHNSHQFGEGIGQCSPPEYIEIGDPTIFTVKKLKNIANSIAPSYRSIRTFGQLQDKPDNATISSIDSICDECTITFHV